MIETLHIHTPWSRSSFFYIRYTQTFLGPHLNELIALPTWPTFIKHIPSLTFRTQGQDVASCVGLRSSPRVLGNLSGGARVTPVHIGGLLGNARV